MHPLPDVVTIEYVYFIMFLFLSLLLDIVVNPGSTFVRAEKTACYEFIIKKACTIRLQLSNLIRDRFIRHIKRFVEKEQ